MPCRPKPSVLDCVPLTRGASRCTLYPVRSYPVGGITSKLTRSPTKRGPSGWKTTVNALAGRSVICEAALSCGEDPNTGSVEVAVGVISLCIAVGDDEVSGRGENTRQANMTSNKGSSKYLRIRVIIAVRIVHSFLFKRILRNICASTSSWYNERVL